VHGSALHFTLPRCTSPRVDEPTAALDPDGLCAFDGLVEKRKKEGKAVLFTTHHLEDVEELADRFALLVEGRLAAILTADELSTRLAGHGGPGGKRMKLEGLYRELVEGGR
jgi:ABC-type multidrug transport system ATPase subunit